MPGPVSTGMGDHLRASKPPQFVTSHSGQLGLLPSVRWKLSTSQSVIMLCGWGVKAGMVDSTCGYMCGWQVKLCDPSLISAIPERFRDEFLMTKHHTILCLLYFIACPARVVRWLDHLGAMCSRAWRTLCAVASRFNSSRGPGKVRPPK